MSSSQLFNTFFSCSLVGGADESEIYRSTERKCRLITKWTLFLTWAACGTFGILPSIIHSMICMWHGNFDTSSWFFATKMSLPFDTSTVYGWYISLIFETLFPFAAIAIAMPPVSLLVGCCLYVVAHRDHFKAIVNKMDAKISLNTKTCWILKMGEIDSDFEDMISFHVKITEWVLLLFIYDPEYSLSSFFLLLIEYSRWSQTSAVEWYSVNSQ